MNYAKKAAGCLSVVVAVAAMGAAADAQQVPDVQAGPVAIVVDNVSLREVDADRILFDIHCHATSSQKLQVKRVRFEHMRLRELPIHLEPIEERLTLEKGVSVALPVLPLTIFYRDIDSLQPLQEAVRDRSAAIRGNARVALDVNLFERWVGGKGIDHVDAPLDFEVPLSIPGGSATQAAALVTLSGAQLALNLGGAALSVLRAADDSPERDLSSEYRPFLVVAESRFSLKLKNNKRVDVTVRGIGFRISEDSFVLSGEMISPWKYDSGVSAALQTGEATLLEGHDLVAWPAGEGLSMATARSVSGQAIEILHSPSKEDVTRVPVEGSVAKVQILRRDVSTNYATLRFVRPEDRGSALPGIGEPVEPGQTWGHLTVFQVDDKGRLTELLLPGQLRDRRIIFGSPVDDNSFGSPILTGDGAVGVVQDEDSGMVFPAKW